MAGDGEGNGLAPREADRGMERGQAVETLRELVLFLPRLLLLFKRLLTDPRVPVRSKMVLAGTVAYLVSPIDVIPDFVPGAGQLDDVVVAVLALHSILNRVDESVVLEHWDGHESVIRMVREGVRAAARVVPGSWDRRV